MAQQYEDAIDALQDPELRRKYDEERRSFMQEIAKASRDHPTIRIPKDIIKEKS